MVCDVRLSRNETLEFFETLLGSAIIRKREQDDDFINLLCSVFNLQRGGVLPIYQ